MKILITGGSGFIGSALIRYLLKNFNTYQILNIDKLTYASNDSLNQFEKNESKSWSRLLDNLKILKAQILLHRGQLDHALSILEELAPSKSVIESGRIIFLKSRVLLRLNRYQEAFDLFRVYYPRLNKIRNLDLPFVEGFYLMYGLFYVLYRYGKVHLH